MVSRSSNECRWVAGVFRMRGLSVLLIEVYLVVGLGIGKVNFDVLMQLETLIRIHKMPVIIGGDWQATPEELAASGWVARNSLTMVAPTNSASTCNSSCSHMHCLPSLCLRRCGAGAKLGAVLSLCRAV